MQGLYIHIPFCTQKCHYCDFVITLDQRESARERFFQAFEKELKQAASVYGRQTFDTLYLGGGTPSLLTEGEMTHLMGLLGHYFDFKPGYEFTCEFNPGDVNPTKMAAFGALGLNRISLGVQAFQEHHLKQAGRFHTLQDTYRTIDILKDSGIQNISMDLILGLPGHALDEIRFSLSETVRLGASQVSIYDLDLHDNTVWGMQYKNTKLVLPEEEKWKEMVEFTESFLNENGYVRYELSNFAKPGYESRHNLIYWHNQFYLGLGPGAFSFMRGKRYQFAKDVPAYLSKCENGDWRNDFEETVDDEKRETDLLLLGLRLKDGIRVEDFPLLGKRLEKGIEDLCGQRLLEKCGDRVRFAPRGKLLVEQTFEKLITGL